MGGQGSGGFRPTAPQNNPMNVNALGGNGQSGQAIGNYTGFAYGQNQAIEQQQAGAPMAKAVEPTAQMATAPMAPVTNIFAPTERPDEPVTHGSDMGPGADSSILTLPQANMNTINDNTGNLIRAMYLQDPTNEDLRLLVKGLDEAGR